MDPLVLRAEFRRTGLYSKWGGDWIRKNKRDGRGELALCSSGPSTWFQLARDAADTLWVIVSPYREQLSYPLFFSRTGCLVMGHPRVPSKQTSFYTETDQWLRDVLEEYPQYQFYFALDADLRGRRVRLTPRLDYIRGLI